MIPLSGLAELEEDLDGLDEEILATGVVLDETPVDNMQANRIRSGNSVLLRGRDAPAFAEEAYAAYGDELVALGFVEKGSFNAKRVFIASQI